MAQEPKIDLALKARQQLNPQLWHALSLLSMGPHELDEALERAVEANPFLRASRVARTTIDVQDAHLEAPSLSPMEALESQIQSARAPASAKSAASDLLPFLTETGYLDATIRTASQRLNRPEREVEEGLRLLQSCDPAGVGARDLAECLRLQLMDLGLDERFALRVVSEIEAVIEKKAEEVARLLGISTAEARDIRGYVRGLRTEPFETNTDNAVALAPDAQIHIDVIGQAKITLLTSSKGLLSLDQKLIDRAMRDPKARDFAVENAKRGRALMRALAFREDTVLRIIETIVDRQSKFFSKTPGPLSPLSRADLAFELEIHPSTVGRAVAKKSVEYQGRVFPLSYFFSQGLGHATQDQISAHEVQTKIARLIGAETADAVLSDAEIQERLGAEGVDISRRTVAKYRGCMNVPASSYRRRKLLRDASYGEAGPASSPTQG